MKTRRRRARDLALQVLFQLDVGRMPVDEALATVPHDDTSVDWEFVEEVSRGTVTHTPELDALITDHLSGWTLDRLASIDRVILRMALYELRYLSTPPGAVINEAVELAKRYGTDESGGFVNGVLGAIHREQGHAAESQRASDH